MGTNTSNYSFFMPDGSDSMGDVETNIINNFKAIEYKNDLTVIAAGDPLPQSGSYELGDRVFRDDVAGGFTWPSNYILICKDANWGWHWRPIQQIISPWVDVPSTAISNADYALDATRPLQIALDSRGYCHWRGVVQKVTAGIPHATTTVIFENIPLGIRPNVRFNHTVALSPITGSATGTAGNISGRIYLREDGYSSIRTFNSDNGITQDIWFDGLNYNNSYNIYYSG